METSVMSGDNTAIDTSVQNAATEDASMVVEDTASNDMDVGNVEEDDGHWFQFIDDENEEGDKMHQRLNNLRIIVSRSLRYRDYITNYRACTVSVTPVPLTFLAMPEVDPVIKRCIHVIATVTPKVESSGSIAVDGTFRFTFRTKHEAEEYCTKLQQMGEGLTAKLLSDQGTDSTDLEKRKVFPHVDPQTHKEYGFIVSKLFPIENDRSTLFVSNLEEEVSEQVLKELFPLARMLIYLTVPFRHAYILFEKEDHLQSSVVSLSAAPKPSQVEKLLTVRLSKAKDAYTWKNTLSAAAEKQKKILRLTEGRPAKQLKASPRPNQPAVAMSLNAVNMFDAPAAPGPPAQGVNPPVVVEPSGGGGPGGDGASDNMDAPKKLTKGQKKRLKLQRAQEAGLQPGQGLPVQGMVQGQMGQGQGQGQAMQVNPGLGLVLQTLSSLAQSLSGTQMQFGTQNARLNQSQQQPAASRLQQLSLQPAQNRGKGRGRGRANQSRGGTGTGCRAFDNQQNFQGQSQGNSGSSGGSFWSTGVEDDRPAKRKKAKRGRGGANPQTGPSQTGPNQTGPSQTGLSYSNYQQQYTGTSQSQQQEYTGTSQSQQQYTTGSNQSNNSTNYYADDVPFDQNNSSQSSSYGGQSFGDHSQGQMF